MEKNELIFLASIVPLKLFMAFIAVIKNARAASHICG